MEHHSTETEEAVQRVGVDLLESPDDVIALADITAPACSQRRGTFESEVSHFQELVRASETVGHRGIGHGLIKMLLKDITFPRCPLMGRSQWVKSIW